MKPMIKLAAILVPLVLTGCSKKEAAKDKGDETSGNVEDPSAKTIEAAPAATEEAQTFAQAMAHVCNAPSAMTPPLADLDPTQKATKLAAWIEKGLTNEEAVALFSSLGSMAPEERIAAVKAAAAKAGIAECEVIGVWTEPSAPDAGL